MLRHLSTAAMDANKFYSLQAQRLGGGGFYDFEQLRGKVVLIVNIASKCGFASQNSGLQQLYDEFKKDGLEILAFPCNQFKNQEPGDAKEIQATCERLTFPIMEKCDVNGAHTHKVYEHIKKELPQMRLTAVKWNYEKFLYDREGKGFKRYSSLTAPESMKSDIQKLLKQKVDVRPAASIDPTPDSTSPKNN